MTSYPVIYAIDIGDTSTRCGFFVAGKVEEVGSISTPRTSRHEAGDDALWRTLRELIDRIAQIAPPMDALAVCASGIMTLRPNPGARSYGPFKDQDVLVLAPNVDGLKYVSILPQLESLTRGRPVHLENDVNAAVMSSPIENAICICLGAGLGAAVKRKGAVQRVPGTWSCYEIGHGMRWALPDHVTRACHCGSVGCLEAAVGGWAMTERYGVSPPLADEQTYARMADDVLQYLPASIAQLIVETELSDVVLTGRGLVGYASQNGFVERLKANVDALLPSQLASNLTVLEFSETAELQGVALSLLSHNVLE